MMPSQGPAGDFYTRTPLAKRLPTVGSLVLAMVLANVFSGSWVVGLGIFVATLVVCNLVLHLVFHQPLERLVQYREYERR